MTSFFLGVRCPVLGREFLKAVRYHNSCCKKPKVMFVPTSHKAAFREKIRGQRCCDSKVPNHLLQAGNLPDIPRVTPRSKRRAFFFFETPRHTLLENGLRVVNIFDPNTTQVGLLQFFPRFPKNPKISDPRQLWQWL